MCDRCEAPHRQAEHRQPEHQQPAQVEAAGEPGVDRDGQDLEHAGREDRQPDLQGAEAAHAPQEQRRQIDGGEDADAGDEREEAAQREVQVPERAQVDDRLAVGEAAPDEGDAATTSWPFSRNRDTSLLPISPVPPITTIFIVILLCLANALSLRPLLDLRQRRPAGELIQIECHTVFANVRPPRGEPLSVFYIKDAPTASCMTQVTGKIEASRQKSCATWNLQQLSIEQKGTEESALFSLLSPVHNICLNQSLAFRTLRV